MNDREATTLPRKSENQPLVGYKIKFHIILKNETGWITHNNNARNIFNKFIQKSFINKCTDVEHLNKTEWCVNYIFLTSEMAQHVSDWKCMQL